jgi:GT2 family glycosyltransferase
MEKKSKTNIVVVCWNAFDYTKATLDSLFASVHHPYFLTIVDNGSRDETLEYLRNLQVPDICEKFTLITNSVNNGYGGAINQGYDVSREHGLNYTCVCNNDLFFQDNWLLSMEQCIEKIDSIGILGTLRPAVNVVHHTQKKSAKSVVDDTPKEYSLQQELEVFQDGYSFEDTAQKIVKINGGGLEYLRCPPNAVVTCCALVRNSALSKLGHLADPQFEIYGSEDLDLSWSLQKIGYACAVLKDVYVHHFRHKSINASNLDRNKYLKENNNKFYSKWKQDVFSFLDREKAQDVDIDGSFSSEENTEYFFLRRINEKVNFLDEYNKHE